MKRRGMHSFRSFFKPCFIPGTPSLSNQPNDGQLRAYLNAKERAEREQFDRNHSLKGFAMSMVSWVASRSPDITKETDASLN
jgi:hypothetical protein